jgi:tight adherence protein B
VSGAASSAIVVLAAAAVLRWHERAMGALRTCRGRQLVAPAWFVRALADAGVAREPSRWWTAAVASIAGAGLLALVVGGPGLAVVATAGPAAAGAALLVAARHRAARLLDAALPELVETMARSLRTGATVAQALDEASTATGGPLRVALETVLAELASGSALVTAIDRWAALADTPNVRLVAAAVALSAETGGGAAQALDGVAATLRANHAVAGELRALASQTHLSAVVIGLAPIVFGGFAAATDRRTATFLLETRGGLACLVGGLILDGLAAWWMQRIMAAAT